MTTVYFVRHAEPDFNVYDDFSRPLTDKGMVDCALVTEFFGDKGVTVVLSSPFKRAFDTVLPFAESVGLEVRIIEDFRERKVADEWILPFADFTGKQWADFSYKLENGECLAEVQARNVSALEGVLREYRGETIVVGSHGTALSTIIHHYDNTYGYEGFNAMKRIFPWIAKLEFDDHDNCMGIEKIDLFSPVMPDYENCKVRTVPLGKLKAYKYTVIFARYRDKWLYCRHKERDVYETAGGRVEDGESMLEAAKREFFEETGAVKFDIRAAFDYSVHLPNVYANGQVFLAHVHELGDMPDFEMGEVALFDAMPNKMRFPKILPVLYLQMQGWINMNMNSAEELCDIYNAHRKLTGRTRRRCEPLKAGEFRFVVLVWLLNSRGEFLITKRASNKGYPNMWECTGGSVKAGDDSQTSALREVKEETGLTVKPENGELLLKRTFGGHSGAHVDVWLFRQDFDLRDVVLQEGETTDAKYATPNEIRQMLKAGEFVRTDYLEDLLALI
ncbi:MAG: NUDIX domain-containing protein [Defluviitaleaceae bacterium]|nr:NUDIX domain-containing protein [Defluviitaleaceae bacterium]